MISIKNLTITYNAPNALFKKIKILDNLTCHINQGNTFGLVGRSGSGKSSILKALLSLVTPSAGQILLDKKSPIHFMKENRIGYLPEHPYYYDHLTATEVITFHSKILKHTFPNRDKLVKSLLEKVHLAYAKDLTVKNFSKSMLRRLGLAQAILHSPTVLLLDEPLYGLDPLGRHAVLKILTELKQIGTTILFCSHNLSDIQALCDEIAIIDKGKIVKQGTIEKVLPNTIAGIELTIEIPKNKKLKEIELLISVIDVSAEQLRLFVPEIDELHKVLYFMHNNSIEIRAIKTIRQSLEDYFLRLVPEDDN